MSKQNNSLEMAVNNLATEMRRNTYLRALGVSGGNTKRPHLYDEFGYPKQITFREFYDTYRRNAVAFAGVHRLLDGCWQDMPDIVDGDVSKKSKKTTKWEKTVAKLMKKQWSKLKDADRRNMVGRYSALLIQLNDSATWDQSVNISTVKAQGENALVKLIPVWEPQLTVAEWDTDITSKNYGMPKMYNFSEQPVGNEDVHGPARYTPVHPDRVIVFCEGADDDDIFSGIPLLEAGYNKLLDLEKVSGGGAEGFLKNASRQIGVEFDKDTNIQALDEIARKSGYKDLGEAMGDKVNKLNRGTDAAAVMQAGRMNVLSVTPGDPNPTWTVTANEFAASIQIPFTILFGQQTGRLASDEDKQDWAIRRNQRRNTFLSDRITALIERFWTIGIIEPPKSGEITVSWPDLLAPSEKDKIANMASMADVAYKTQQAFGQSAIEPNEVREVGELEPLPDAENERERPTQTEAGDPLNGDTTSEDASATTQPERSDAEQQSSQQDAA
ncbi:DUF1073 domain-containing protein [Enterobacter hormaechei]|nr:DUF1073 domain-containing protein [Enterobacter hormaechei]